MARHRKLTQKFAGFPMFKLATSGDTFPVTSPFTTDFVGLDGLALDLQFAADKTLTARKGPTPAFTRGSSGTFVGSNGLIQSAGTNVARFDHNPVSLACKGLLIEESRTNNSRYSGALVLNTGWLFIQALPATSGTGPDGNTAYQVTETAALDNHLFGNTGGTGGAGATSVVSGTIYTGSIFLKKVAGSVDWVQLTFSSAGFGLVQYANFNIGTGTVGNSTGLASGTVPRIEAFPNGWYRCSISVAATATTSSTSNIVVAFTNNLDVASRTPIYTGSASNSLLATMCQFETGSFPTSYIPTTTASVIRSADVCSISGSAFSGFYNPLEGSFATSQIFNAPLVSGQGQIVFDVNDTTNSNRTRVFRFNTTGFVGFSSTAGSIQDVSITGSTAIAAGAITKFAGCMKENDFAIYFNNVLQGVDTTAVMLSAPTTFMLGEVSSGTPGKLPLNGTILSICYYRKRLSNAKLQALTV